MLEKRNLILAALIAIVLVATTTNTANAQESISFQNKLKSMLSNFNNIRFSSIAYYEINDRQVRSLKEVIKKKLDIDEDVVEESGVNQDVGIDPAQVERLVNEVRRLMQNGLRSFPQVRRAFNGEIDGFEHLEDEVLTEPQLRMIFQMAQPTQRARADIYRMFLLTMPQTNPNEVPEIIALILCKQRVDKHEYEAYLIQFYNEVIGNSLSSERNILTHTELINFIIEDDDGYETKTTNLYEKLQLLFRQGNCQLITPEVRGIGTELKFVNHYGKSTSMISNENNITSRDISRFIRISDGQPFDYFKPNELIISPDYISFRKYEMEYWEDEEGNMVPSYFAANENLPNIGAEIKFGLDEISYPSFWSERMMVRAIWDNAKLGIVLPTSGWSSLSKDLFSIDRRFTHAGVGLSGALDLPIKIIPQSGIFNFSGSYVFGDAVAASYKDRKKYYEDNGFPAEHNPDDLFFNDYLIRFTAQSHYTFGFTIDETYLLRIGIGATVYGAENWHDKQETNDDMEDVISFVKGDSETIGGISMKLEFMSRDISTPFGGSLQYFDESLFTNVWLQIPVVKDTFYLKVEAKGFIPAFKNVPHPWENKGAVIIPTARLIFNF